MDSRRVLFFLLKQAPIPERGSTPGQRLVVRPDQEITEICFYRVTCKPNQAAVADIRIYQVSPAQGDALAISCGVNEQGIAVDLQAAVMGGKMHIVPA